MKLGSCRGGAMKLGSCQRYSSLKAHKFNLSVVHCMPEISKVSYLSHDSLIFFAGDILAGGILCLRALSYLSHGSLIFFLAEPPLRLLF
jgi:hypothetical protein